jgi:putative two-component system response regulator
MSNLTMRSSNSPSQPDACPPRVLVVDDESYVRNLVSRWLTDAGFPCAQATSAEAAWKHLSENDVHLAVLDINMPGRSGLDLLGDIRTRHPDMAVLMMTAMNDTKVAIQALTNGAAGYLVKPVEREELLFQARAAIERRQLIVERREYTRGLEEKVRQATQAIRLAHEETIYRLSAASLCRDEETGMHIHRTGLLSELLARAAGWSAADCELIRMAAPMHDVGKIGIPDAILRKPGKLTPEEYEIMKTHTTVGAKMLAGSQSAVLAMAGVIALNHHERWDGTGYPQGLAGDAIPEVARIVAIVDVYDALCHARIYRPAMPEKDVLEHMRRASGTHFDPLLLATFFSCLDDVHRLTQEHQDEMIHAWQSSDAGDNAPSLPTWALAPPCKSSWEASHLVS